MISIPHMLYKCFYNIIFANFKNKDSYFCMNYKATMNAIIKFIKYPDYAFTIIINTVLFIVN